jgi:hypothetical protein
MKETNIEKLNKKLTLEASEKLELFFCNVNLTVGQREQLCEIINNGIQKQ